MAALAILLIAAVWLSWQFAWRWLANKTDDLLRADLGYWVCMFIAGTLGTVIGDYCSHNLRLDDAGAALLLSPIVVLLLVTGRRGLLLSTAVLLADVSGDQGGRDGGRRSRFRPEHAWPAIEHCSHGNSVRRAAADLEAVRKSGANPGRAFVT
jgi:hypothetical protein